ncbi:MAG: hypothetical protein P1U56_26190 [Saprospiraceae bacterium]|nr:hypothetical protein [Saprospiraceae bacterium]
MKINLKHGIGRLKFGMKSNQVKQILGDPSEKKNGIGESHEYYLIYNRENLTLTFYLDEGNKLGYIKTSNPEVSFNGQKIISRTVKHITDNVFKTKIPQWELETHDSFSTLFNQEFWLTLYIEYDKITTVELGVSFKDDENYLWPNEIDESLKMDVPNSTCVCDECGSHFFKVKLDMIGLCPECAHKIYGYQNCEHNFNNGRCTHCYWDGSKSDYLNNKSST